MGYVYHDDTTVLDDYAGVLGSTYYYLYCDKCGSWDIKVYFSVLQKIYNVMSSGCLGFWILAAIIFPPFWIFVILYGFFATREDIRTENPKPRVKCLNCGSQWKGTKGHAKKTNYEYELKDIPVGVTHKAHCVYETGSWSYR